MADEAVTVAVTYEEPLRDGVKMIAGTITGSIDYNAGTGNICDLSTYLGTIYGGVSLNGCTALADNAVVAAYVSADLTNAATGVIVCHWSADGTDGEVFVEVTDQTNMGGYVWHFTAIGTEVTRT